jgi:pyrimidine-nucleoside phosphorylase
MRTLDIIRKKRDGAELGEDEIGFFIEGVTSGEIPDYQASAFLMAVCLKGATDAETVSLTRAMMQSGEAIDLKGVTGPKVDKHSTGGVGDKTSIILAPLLASMGIKVPMVAGRGLGHTGGTLDKLESIPGMRTDLGLDEFRGNLKNPGLAIMGQTESMAPADRKLYALRDVTATVESIPLIASSIMSKKLSEGIDGLVLDVKTGSGAFMKDLEDARKLARTMVNIGNSMGIKTVALITDMEQPLGRTVGNALEIKECVSALRGKGAGDLMSLTLTLAAWMLNMADAISEETDVRPLKEFVMRKYRHEAMEFIDKGDAFKKFVELVDAQHGDPEAAFSPARLPVAPMTKAITSGSEGYVRRLDARAVGEASMLLGAGRSRAEDAIDPSAGIILNRKVGDHVKAGEPLAMLHYSDDRRLKDAEEAFFP